jgi:hypothetical protein
MTHFGEIPESAGVFTRETTGKYFCGKCKASVTEIARTVQP